MTTVGQLCCSVTKAHHSALFQMIAHSAPNTIIVTQLEVLVRQGWTKRLIGLTWFMSIRYGLVLWEAKRIESLRQKMTE